MLKSDKEDINDFLMENTDQYLRTLDKYNQLNSINIPSKRAKFPYNILSIDIQPTYKTLSLQTFNKLLKEEPPVVKKQDGFKKDGFKKEFKPDFKKDGFKKEEPEKNMVGGESQTNHSINIFLY